MAIDSHQAPVFNGGMVGTGRKPEGIRIEVRIKAETLMVIDRRASEQGVSRSAMIRQLLEESTR